MSASITANATRRVEDPATAYARQAPPAMAAQALNEAIQVKVLRKALDAGGQAALQLLSAALSGKGARVDLIA